MDLAGAMKEALIHPMRGGIVYHRRTDRLGQPHLLHDGLFSALVPLPDELVGEFQQMFDVPQFWMQTVFVGGCHAPAVRHPAEIMIHDPKGQMTLMILEALGEGVGLAREPAVLHSQVQILALDK